MAIVVSRRDLTILFLTSTNKAISTSTLSLLHFIPHALPIPSNFLMVLRWMMFSEVIGMIVGAFIPIDVEFLLGLSISQPMVAHVPGF